MRRFFIFLSVSSLLAAMAAAGLWAYAEHSFSAPGPLAADITVMIAPKTPVRRIAEQLAGSHVVAHRKVFLAMLMLHGDPSRLKAGEYRFAAGISPQAVAQQMILGRVVVHDVTIPEGLTVAQALAILGAEPLLGGPLPIPPAEGSLLPETYQFLRGDLRVAVVERMKKARQKALVDAWPKRAPGLPFASPDQALILASIVEKETGKAEERPHVASVFLNRLAAKMPLQSDPTTIYGLYKESGILRLMINRADLAHPTPYNTYTLPGLPAGPICNPGRASIEAVLHPAATRDLYFVADGTGGHRFAATLADHNRNVATYRAASRAPD